jgi:hypothetical protein
MAFAYPEKWSQQSQTLDNDMPGRSTVPSFLSNFHAAHIEDKQSPQAI